MRSSASLLVLVLATSALAASSIPVVRMPNGLNWAPDGTATGDHKFVTLYPAVQDGVNGLWCSDCKCDTNGRCIQGTKGVDGAFAFRKNGVWECQCQTGSCFDCSDLMSCPCIELAGACDRTSECCTGFCRDGLCTLGCLANGSPCTLGSECCIGACTGGLCALPTTTSTSTSTSTTTTTSTTTSTSSTSTLNTSTTTSSSTSTTTSTSTSTVTTTSNTCPTTTTRPSDAAPDWSSNATFAGVWHFEDCPTDGLADDSSPSNNDLGSYVQRSSTAAQLVSAWSVISFGDNLFCSTAGTFGGTCNVDDFQFSSGDFTAGLFSRRTVAPGVGPVGGETEGLSSVGIFAGAGWAQTAYRLSGDPSTTFRLGFYIRVGNTITEVATANTFSLNTYVHHATRFTNSTGLMENFANGILDANTATSAPPVDPGTGAGSFALGGFSNRGTVGQNDEGWVWKGCMTAQDVCRIALCNVDGSGCRCSGITYIAAARSSMFGGSFTCAPGPCNQAAPRLCSATTSTTVTTTSTSTSTTTTTL